MLYLGLCAGEQLLHNEPFIYDQNLPKSMQSEYPIMDEVIQSLKPKSIYNIAQLTSAAGIRFLSFAKSRRFGDGEYCRTRFDSGVTVSISFKIPKRSK